jgi:hypothetical protein
MNTKCVHGMDDRFCAICRKPEQRGPTKSKPRPSTVRRHPPIDYRFAASDTAIVVFVAYGYRQSAVGGRLPVTPAFQAAQGSRSAIHAIAWVCPH